MDSPRAVEPWDVDSDDGDYASADESPPVEDAHAVCGQGGELGGWEGESSASPSVGSGSAATAACADDDFQDAMELLLDDAYFGEDAYRGPPPPPLAVNGGGANPRVLSADFQGIAEADIEAFLNNNGSSGDGGGGGGGGNRTGAVRHAMSQAAAAALLAWAPGAADDGRNDESARDLASSCGLVPHVQTVVAGPRPRHTTSSECTTNIVGVYD